MKRFRCQNCGRVLFHAVVREGEVSVRCKRCGFLNHFLFHEYRTVAQEAHSLLAVAPVRRHPGRDHG